jgi:translation initiation factor IF-3
MATVLTLQTRLSEAESALHLLAQGKRTVTVQFEGRTVTYTQSTMQELTQYVDRLRVELSTATAAAAGTRKVKQIRLYGGKGF